jgi:hypothetical protein
MRDERHRRGPAAVGCEDGLRGEEDEERERDEAVGTAMRHHGVLSF